MDTRLRTAFVFLLLGPSLLFSFSEETEHLVYGCVDPISGAFIEENCDLLIGGQNPLELKRSYNHLSCEMGRLGFGFTDNLYRFLSEEEAATSEDTVEIEDSQGSLCLYRRVSSSLPLCFYLQKETLPSGICVHYDYHPSTGELQRIYTTNGKGARALHSFTIDQWYDRLTVTASNGKQATYEECWSGHPNRGWDLWGDTQATADDYRVLQCIYTTDLPKKSYEYSEGVPYITKRKGALGGFLDILYDREDKVKMLRGPNREGASTTLYTFAYNLRDNSTNVFDAYGFKTCYRYTDEHLLCDKEEYDKKWGKHNPYRTQHFFWDKETLQGMLVKDGDGKVRSSIQYKHDPEKNTFSKTIYGNLSGQTATQTYAQSNPDRPPLRNAEQYTRTFIYSKDRLRLLLEETEEEGPTIRYTYLPGTNLCTSQLTYAEENILKRTFWEYNEYAFLTKEITDDGCAENKADLTHVTERKIHSYVFSQEPNTPGFGLPVEEREGYLDLLTGEEKQLKRTEYLYGLYDLIREKRIYNADNQYCYTLLYDYDDRGNLIRETDALGRTWYYTYDEEKNKVSSHLEGTKGTTYYTYDLCNQLIEERTTYADGSETSTKNSYNLRGEKISSQDCHGNETTYRYDSLGRLVELHLPSFTNSAGYLIKPVEKRTYNIADSLTSIFHTAFTSQEATEEERGSRRLLQSTAFNGREQPISHRTLDGTETFTTYYLNGLVEKKTSADGGYTLYIYDPLQRVLQEQRYDNEGTPYQTIQNRYSAFHLLETIDSNGLSTTYSYDGAGRLIEESQKTEGELLAKAAYAYDPLGRLTKINTWYEDSPDAYGSLFYIYDYADRLVETRKETAEGSVCEKTTTSYDLLDRPVETAHYVDKKTPALTKRNYNAQGQLSATTDPMGETTRYYYSKDPTSKVFVKQTIDPRNNCTKETFDAYGQLCKEERYDQTGTLLASQEFFYDSERNCVQAKEAILFRGEECGNYTTDWLYNKQNQLIQRTEHKEAQKPLCTKYSYDLHGRLETVEKPDHVLLHHRYDTRGNLAKFYSNDKTIHYRYSYDSNNNLVQVEDLAENKTAIRSYDKKNRLISETQANGLSSHYTYDLTDRPLTITLCDQSSIHYYYDAFYPLSITRKNAKGEDLYAHFYDAFDWQGHCTQMEMIDGNEVNLSYDLLGRARALHTPLFTQTIPSRGYDSAGNLVHITDTQETHYSYNALNQLEKEEGMFSHTYLHDSTGNRRGRDACDYLFNEKHQIVYDERSIYMYNGNGDLSEKINPICFSYRYDALGRLTSVMHNREWRFLFTYDWLGRRQTKTVQNWDSLIKNWRDELSESYLYYKKQEIGATEDFSDLLECRVPDAQGNAVALEIEGKHYIPLYDLQGNVALLIDASSKEIATRYYYSAFGETKQEGALTSPWQFAGKRRDSETGLLYHQNHFYDPQLGRSIEKPIRTIGGGNKPPLFGEEAIAILRHSEGTR